MTRDDLEVKTLANALGLLDLFIVSGGDGRGLRASDLARQSSVSEITVLRTLNTLVKYEYLEYEKASGIYRLSSKWMRASAVYRRHHILRRIAVPHLAQLAEQCDACASLWIESRGEVMLIDRVMKPSLHAIFSPSGSCAAWHSTSAGKVIAAYKPDHVIAEYLKHGPFPAFTATTIVDPESLAEHLRQVRAQGYAIDASENMQGVYCVATPVFLRGREVMAAMSLAAPNEQLVQETRLSEVLESLRQACTSVAGLVS